MNIIVKGLLHTLKVYDQALIPWHWWMWSYLDVKSQEMLLGISRWYHSGFLEGINPKNWILRKKGEGGEICLAETWRRKRCMGYVMWTQWWPLCMSPDAGRDYRVTESKESSMRCFSLKTSQRILLLTS